MSMLAEAPEQAQEQKLDQEQVAERVHCYLVAKAWAEKRGFSIGDPCPTGLVEREREAARAQVRAVYRELADAVGDFLGCPESLGAIAKAYDKVKGL